MLCFLLYNLKAILRYGNETMKNKDTKKENKPSINDEISTPAQEIARVAQAHKGLYNGEDSSFKLAFDDTDFLTSHETRGIRFQLEITKPDVVLRREGIRHTITVFGSARFKDKKTAQKMLDEAVTEEELRVARLAVKNSEHYQKAYDFGHLVAQRNIKLPVNERLIICTGGGPGIMEAANRGAFESGDKTIGMNIALPFEQEPNPYITPSLCFDFHYFASRKFSILSGGSSTAGYKLEPGTGLNKTVQTNEGGGSVAIIGFAGGFGTLDEIFEATTLCQCGKMHKRPIILVGKEYWTKFMNIQFLADEGAISQEDVDLIKIVDSAEECWDVIKNFYQI